MDVTEILVVVLMIFINAIFAAYEIALASVPISRLEQFARDGHRGAATAVHMKNEIEQSLAVVQLGITLVGFIAGAIGGVGASDQVVPLLERWGVSPSISHVLAVALIVLPLTALTIVVGELMPKLFALRNKEWICLTLSPIMALFARSVWPIVWLLEASASGLMDLMERLWHPRTHGQFKLESSTLQELRAIAGTARTSRLIGVREENIILGAARLSSRALKEIMLPIEHVSTLNLQDSINQSLIKAHMEMHTRFPVADHPDDPQSIVGYVTFKDIVAILRVSPQEPSLKGILRAIPRLPEQLPISSALEQLLREHTHIAMVCDADGLIVGMITLEDILEELIGDIQDEYDFLPIHAVRSGTGWVVGGGISLPRLTELTGMDFGDKESLSQIHNLNGWILNQLGHSPPGGETLHHDGWRILVRKVRRKRVLEAFVSPTPQTNPLSNNSGS